MDEPDDTRAFWAQASPPDGVPLHHASILRLQVRPRTSEDLLVDVEVTAPEPGWGAVETLDKALAERGWHRSWGWGEGPRRSLVAWLRDPAEVPAHVGST